MQLRYTSPQEQRRPASVYIAFMVAMAFEMFGIPMSMYIIAWVLGNTLPDGILWGHTLYSYIGHAGMYVGTVIALIGAALVILGWKEVYKRYWSKEEGQGELVTDGVYGLMRHPQYTGFLMITLGMLCDWATLPMLIMWPILSVMYYRLARREEGEMREQFGAQYDAYRRAPACSCHACLAGAARNAPRPPRANAPGSGGILHDHAHPRASTAEGCVLPGTPWREKAGREGTCSQPRRNRHRPPPTSTSPARWKCSSPWPWATCSVPFSASTSTACPSRGTNACWNLAPRRGM
ncbi:MAG: methyltransferase family protein [Anaerolineae bacterium]